LHSSPYLLHLLLARFFDYVLNVRLEPMVAQ
jgi:hypothetical protein